MYLPTDETLVTAVVLSHQHQEAGNRRMMQSWAILAHNHACREGYYADGHGEEIDWETWAMGKTF